MIWTYLQLGIDHILDINGIDHVLFLVALAIPYSLDRWKSVLLLATAFTLGHCVTLILSALDLVAVRSDWIEIGIAASIFIMAIGNIYYVLRNKSFSEMSVRYSTVIFFGLIHGLGFSNFFKTIIGKEDITVPLLAFNIGVEIAQVLVVSAVILISFLINKAVDKKWSILLVSLIICVWSAKLVLERI